MPFHEVTGDLLELQGDMGIVTLEGGILLPVPVYYIQMLEA